MLIPLFFLVFMIPLPNFLLNNLSTKLQLISSELGVAVIRLFDISVYLEGNVIDLGVYKLQVVEACSGLNYLFPLMSLSFIMADLYKAPFWKRAIVFLSSIPITIIMNSFNNYNKNTYKNITYKILSTFTVFHFKIAIF